MTDNTQPMDEGLEPRRVLNLIDDNNETLPVEVVLEIEIEGNLYALFTPAQPLVEILCEDMVDEEAALEELEPSEFKGDLKHHITSALRELQVSIEVRANEFVLIGELPDEAYEASEMIELEGESDSKEYLVIMEVEDAMKRYLIALPTEPEIYAGEILADEKARHLNDEELQRYQQYFEEALFAFTGDEEDEEA
jgi:hypothetical protein